MKPTVCSLHVRIKIIDNSLYYNSKNECVVGLCVEKPPAFYPVMNASFAGKCRDLEAQSYLVFLRRIFPKKGVNLLIRGYVFISEQKGSDSSQRTAVPDLVIGWPFDSAYAKEMKDLAAELLPSGLKTENLELETPKIHFVGMLTGDANWGRFTG
jgi:hypothetical protein